MLQTVILQAGSDRSKTIERVGIMLNALPKEVAFKVEVSEYKPRRSDAQNRYLWGVAYREICKHLPGWHAEDVHEYFLGEWSGWETVEGLGRKRMRPLRRSARLSKTEFSEYVAFIQQRAAEHGIFIEDPG